MDRPLLEVLAVAGIVEAVAQGVEHVPFDAFTDRHRDRGACIGDLGSAHQAVGGLHGDAAHQVIAEVLGHLQGQGLGHGREGDVGVQCVEQLRHRAAGELHVDDGAGDTHHPTGGFLAARGAVGLCGDSHVLSSLPGGFYFAASESALAPPTISEIS